MCVSQSQAYILSILDLIYRFYSYSSIIWYSKTDKRVQLQIRHEIHIGNGSILNTDFICSINGSIDIHLPLSLVVDGVLISIQKSKLKPLFGIFHIFLPGTNQIYSHPFAILVQFLIIIPPAGSAAPYNVKMVKRIHRWRRRS